jgi:large subunit ribosomal protein L25
MELIGQKREKFGKKNKGLRVDNLIPGVVFGKGLESVPVIVGKTDFTRLYREVGDTGLVELKVEIGSGNGGNEISDVTSAAAAVPEEYTVLVNEVQLDPVSDDVIHISFYKPDLTIRTSVSIPVEVVGEEDCELVKSGAAVVITLLQEIEVEALPADLPSNFEVNVSGLAEIDAGIMVSDLAYDREKVEIVGAEEDALVVKLEHAVMEEEAEEEISEEEALAGIEATEEKGVEEGEGAEEGGKSDSKDATGAPEEKKEGSDK